MAFESTQFSVILFGLEKILKMTALRTKTFARRLQEKNLIAQIKLRDNSQGRYFIFQDGKVSSQAGIHDNPDIAMIFEDAETAVRLMSPAKTQLEFISAAKHFQIDMQGPDELTLWFAETLNMTMNIDPEYGVDMGKGVKRYTSNTNGGPVFVYVKDGKIIRITPIDFEEEDADPWVVTARGKTFSPPKKTTVNPHTLAWKSMIYSPDRLLYPMKRVDFDPNGERNPQNRGISGYERISWDEALTIVVNEIKRVKKTMVPGPL